MSKEFRQIAWDSSLADEARTLIRTALAEDLGPAGDCTTLALVPDDAHGAAVVAARRPGVIAGLPMAALVCELLDSRLAWQPAINDGGAVTSGDRVARIEGPTRSLLSAERTLLNVLGRLSGVASLARQYVEAVSGTRAGIYDTRKTTPGWRRLEKYAVRCGGGRNHRNGLFDAVLIKDNHLAQGAAAPGKSAADWPAEAVRAARRYLAANRPESAAATIVEVEVDTLDQFERVLPAAPDIVLLDNMSPEQLRQAVAIRDRLAPGVELEASGGVNLATVRAIAEAGVERISVGGLTHSAPALDLGLDWG